MCTGDMPTVSEEVTIFSHSKSDTAVRVQHDSLLTRHVLSGGVDAGEGTSGLHHVLGPGVTPLDVGGVHLAEHLENICALCVAFTRFVVTRQHSRTWSC